MDYTGLLNEKENQLVELEKKIQNLEERLRRATMREKELEDEIVRLHSALKAVDKPNCSRQDIEKILQISTESRTALENFQRLQGQIAAFASLSQAQFEKLRQSGIRCEYENELNALMSSAAGKNYVGLGGAIGSDGKVSTTYSGVIGGINFLPGTHAVGGSSVLAVGGGGIVSGHVTSSNISRTGGSTAIVGDGTIGGIIGGAGGGVGGIVGGALEASIVNGVVHLTDYRDRIVEVPVQDSRTKHLVHMLAVQMKKYFDKYPKLINECDTRLYEFFQQELIDVIEVDELDKVVEIVKYVPEVVKVENVYAYSSEKSRKVEFHLRILIKALLEELEKLKRRTGAVLEIDEGIIGMINQEIMGVVDVDDILKVFRVVPKIVEVEKIVEKVVDRVVEVPQVVPIEKIVEKIIEVPKVQ